MNKKCSKKYSVELTKEELDILYKARDIIDEIDDFAIDNDIEEFQNLLSINDYIDALEPKKETKIDSSAWECPEWYTEEQRRCFYGNFG